MDRFIVMFVCKDCHDNLHLKSNMDRFIVMCVNPWIYAYTNLKSNMDRFIADCTVYYEFNCVI